MKIEVWSLPGCERCEAAKAAIRSAGHEAVERNLQAVDRRNAHVLTQAELQNGYAPVLRVDSDRPNEFIDPEFLVDWLKRHPTGG